jgi:hypothetical protein
MKLNTHLYLVQRVRMRGAVPPLTSTYSWRGTSLNKGYVLMTGGHCSLYSVLSKFGISMKLVRGKCRVVPVLLLTEHCAMKAYWGNGSIDPFILLPRHEMEVSGQLHAPAALLLGKDPLVPVGFEAGWAPEPFWTRC